MWDQFMSELAHAHLGRPHRQKGPSVAERLQAAYDALCARRTRRKKA
jgi:hypothetical protein